MFWGKKETDRSFFTFSLGQDRNLDAGQRQVLTHLAASRSMELVVSGSCAAASTLGWLWSPAPALVLPTSAVPALLRIRPLPVRKLHTNVAHKLPLCCGPSRGESWVPSNFAIQCSQTFTPFQPSPPSIQFSHPLWCMHTLHLTLLMAKYCHFTILILTS